MLIFALLALVPPIPDDMPIPVYVGGRVTADLEFGWPGVYFEGRFRGSDVTVEVESENDSFRLLIDGTERATLRGGAVRFTVRDLPAAEHVVRLEKLTESQSGKARFRGFFTRTGQPVRVRPRARQIEVIGDSHSVGYGDLSPTRACNGAQVHDTTDTQAAFGPLLAKRLDADYRVIAYSGYGVVRNYAGRKPGENLPFLYPRAIPADAAPAAVDPAWRPQLIVINLGTNDFSTSLHAGEAWADDAALRADWRARYVDFVRALKVRQPGARFVLMGAANFIADTRAVGAATGATVVEVPTLELTGCNYHPSLKDQQVMAGVVEAAAGTLD
ncbi:SGNH/GDSL hydrolase family protein [Sphingomonas hengshuiensis]|uniref:Lipase n=1 Tax=Sphingomonas hengshuiensis TaxID=1609977 RepID=A0A7U5BEX0_9SPHN|nr:SGNH/GDSL hydrolase family protein [Sphingomonas hengshuiensis]AJP73993.1 lipase [Sphingomonas hengshuiensis]